MKQKVIIIINIIIIFVFFQFLYSCISCPYECSEIANVKIMSKGKIKTKNIISFIKEANPEIDQKELSYIIKIYKKESKSEGVNSDVAIAQMILETGYLKFDGVMDKSQNNFAGIGADKPGVKGNIFPDIPTGIRAQIQHLKAYGCTSNIKSKLVDERFHLVKRGCAPTVLDLSGEWAVDKNYGKMIIDIMNRMKK